MKVSLITVCLNSESTILGTLESVIAQDHVDREHIIFDGGSTDQTLSIVKSFGDEVRLIEGKDSGIFDAMNQAIGYATGEVIAIINSDDFYAHHQVLSDVVHQFESTGSDTVYGDLQYVERHSPDKIYRNWKSGEFERSKFKFGWSIPHPSFFVKREVYDRYGLFDEQFKISGDYELILRFLYIHKQSASYLPEVLVKMRTGGNSDGGIKRRFESLKEDYQAWTENGIRPAFYTVPLKPMRKFRQFFT
ncbi:glycosyltransferase [Roseivirga ehrenbergii]|uniref:glycosyltransferase family 2 protein n=1 Tax=Roseivirga ehrenbergii (strain DSM 102268 / JCM 13514 / KCTC 12282 / NCIMB 14502 / KMM 6017) TaxID=279360 RepID=UPI000A06172A|nr:glycosyltransferase family 2 protein [Roseivirga ehrenbergii]TCL00903.1 glycosyltransferase [Roseivirga ehrenbergii]